MTDVALAFSVRLPTESQRRSLRRRRAWGPALALILAVHLGLFYLASRSWQDQLRLAANGGEGGMSIGLVGPPADMMARSRAAAAQAPDSVAPASLPMLDSDNTARTKAAPPPVEGPSTAQEQVQSGGDGSTGQAPGAAGEPTPVLDPYARASIQERSRAADLADSRLFSQIEHCWKTPAAPVSLVLAVTLDAGGAVVGEPIAVRAPDAQAGSEVEAQEQLAKDAVKACAPYVLTDGNSARSHRIAFAAAAQPGLSSMQIIDAAALGAAPAAH